MKSVRFADGDGALPVGKILCLGRNYAAHAREMKSEIPSTPVVFMKPSTALLPSGGVIRIPPISHDVHHEVEMVVVIGKAGKDIPRDRAMEHVGGYAVGLDMTLRDVQAEAKQKGLPWTVAKCFDTSAPLSPAVRTSAVADPHALDISLRVNGAVRQASNTRNMLFTIPDIIAYCSSVFTLEPGDLIFTGTPEGVGPVAAGDTLTAELESVGSLTVGVQ
jgi:2-keto-4-pentenoate hydratase/2-oxohepta-3-ene-1,7-dioic acid hydratase in catechol pathway